VEQVSNEVMTVPGTTNDGHTNADDAKASSKGTEYVLSFLLLFSSYLFVSLDRIVKRVDDWTTPSSSAPSP
jgi:hypothetical protein